MTRPITYRSKVLGRALLAARTDPNRFWKLLSGNPEVAFPSVIASLPAPAPATAIATAAATFTANAVSPFVAATPSYGQKCNVYP
jgi:hypothetical protein